jgi:WD40 repeat protein/serine/threonine protein kinase
MNHLQTHPTTEQLSAYRRGDLDSTAEAVIEEHLLSCDTCCGQLESTWDSLVSNLRGGAAQEEATESDAIPAELANHPRYRVVKLLGRGGMGDVYQAEHRLMHRIVALKLIKERCVRNPAAIDRFRREVRAAARLVHPHIVTAYDAEQAGHLHFLVMEYVDGVELAEVVKQQGPLPVWEACDYVRQAALGLQHAYEQGMVHRDIKPHNLMVTNVRKGESVRREAASATDAASASTTSGVVKILDFGLASLTAEGIVDTLVDDADATGGLAASQLTAVGTIMGTPDYIAPEQAIDAHSADIRADIYGLGCTLYYLLAGNPPFQESTIMGKLLAHSRQQAQPLSQLRQDVPAELESIVGRMMAKSPDDRFATPAEVAAALAPFAGVAPASPVQSSAEPRPGLVPPRRRWFVPVAATTALLLAFLGILSGVIVVATNRGRIEIHSEVDDVQVVVKQDGQEIAVIDLTTGSQVKWLSTGSYELALIGDHNRVNLDVRSFRMTRLGRVIVTARWDADGIDTVESFDTSQATITRDGIQVEEDSWRIAADSPRSVRLFEIPQPGLGTGPFFYRAKLRSEQVQGRAYLEMWVRLPGKGEFFSKGLDATISGTTDWAEYEIPFLLRDHDRPDLVKLNLAIEGSGTVWIKDIELRGRTETPALPASVAAEPQDALLALQGEKPYWMTRVLFSRDGRQAISAAHEIYVWNLQTGGLERKFGRQQGDIWGLALSPDGASIATTDANVVRLWDLDTGEQRREFPAHEGRVMAVAFSPDGTQIASAGFGRQIRLWDVASGESRGELMHEAGEIRGLAFSPNGKYLASGQFTMADPDAEHRLVHLWDLEKQQVLRRFHTPGARITSVAFSPDSRTLMASSFSPDSPLCLWDVTSGALQQVLAGHTGSEFATFSPDGRFLISCGFEVSEDQQQGDRTVRVWEVAAGREVYRFPGHAGGPLCVAVAPDGRILSSGKDSAVRLWRLPKAEEAAATSPEVLRIETHETPVWGLAFSPDGTQIASGGTNGDLLLHHVSSGRQLREFPGHTAKVHGLCFSADGLQLLSASWDGTVRLWDVAAGDELRRFEGHTGLVHAAVWSPDGKQFVSCTHEGHAGAIWLWEAGTGEVLRKFEGVQFQPFSVSFSPDGQHVLSGSHDGTMRLWDVATGREIKPFRGHTDWVISVSFSHDGIQAVSGSKDQTIRIWDVGAGTELRRLSGHTDMVPSVQYTPDGRHVLSGSLDRTVRLWDAATGDELRRFLGHSSNVERVAVSADGRRAASAGSDKSVRVWRLD